MKNYLTLLKKTVHVISEVADCRLALRAGSHFDISISISISINISIRKICMNRGYISISIRMAIAQAQYTSQESKMADNEVEIGLLLLLSHRNRRRLLMQRQTQRKPRKVWIRDIFTRRNTYHSLIQPLLLHHSKPTFSCFCL